MSTKNIAVDTRVYEKLSRLKREGESFSKLIDKLVEEGALRHTGASILETLSRGPEVLTEEEAAAMQRVVDGNRALEDWQRNDLS